MADDKQGKNKKIPHRWKPGESGNPKGRPRKDVCLTSMVKELMDDVPELMVGNKKNEKTWRELIVQAWLVGSYKGNATFFKELLERIEGKVAQPLTGSEGEPLVPPVTVFKFADGTEYKLPRNGHKSAEAIPSDNGDKTTPG